MKSRNSLLPLIPVITSFRPVVALAALAALTSGASAASIIWGTATNVAADTDIATDGTSVAALNFGSSTDEIINGVTFKGYTLVTGSGSTTTYDVTNPAAGTWGNNFFTGYLKPSALSAGSAYATALSTGSYFNGQGNTGTETLSGLTVGQEYEIQVWYNDERSTNGTDTMTFGSGTSNPTVVLTSNPSLVTSQFAIGTFTADNIQQTLTFKEGTSKSGATINMFQIRAVPEPSAIISLVGGLGMLLGVRRRRLMN